MATATEIIHEIHTLPRDQQRALFDQLSKEITPSEREEGDSQAGVWAELADEYRQCSQPNWDGYGAKALAPSTYEYARRFIGSLPGGISMPEVCAEADGHLCLEWQSAPEQSVSISLSESGELHYAALFGRNQSFGTEHFEGRAPRILVELIQRATAQ